MNSPWMLLPALAIAAVLWSVFKKPPTDYMPPQPAKERTDFALTPTRSVVLTPSLHT